MFHFVGAQTGLRSPRLSRVCGRLLSSIMSGPVCLFLFYFFISLKKLIGVLLSWYIDPLFKALFSNSSLCLLDCSSFFFFAWSFSWGVPDLVAIGFSFSFQSHFPPSCPFFVFVCCLFLVCDFNGVWVYFPFVLHRGGNCSFLGQLRSWLSAFVFFVCFLLFSNILKGICVCN